MASLSGTGFPTTLCLGWFPGQASQERRGGKGEAGERERDIEVGREKDRERRPESSYQKNYQKLSYLTHF